MKHLLALDAGTGSGRAVIFNEKGQQLAAAGREWTHKAHPEYPGSMDFDTETNWRLLVECIREASAQVDKLNIVSVSTTSMREGIVVYDQRGQELWACANVDARAIQEVGDLRAKAEGLERELYLLSGQTFALGAPPRLLWLKRHLPKIYEKAASFAMLSDWIAHRLGAPVAVDPSNGGTTGMFNLKTRAWSPEVAQKCGLRPDLLNTPVYESGTTFGEISPKASQETGLKAGTPIVMGGGDAQLGTIGLGIIHAEETAVLGGTFWQQMVNLPAPVSDATGRIRMNFHAIPDMWQAEAIVFFPGFAARWFRDAIAPDIKASAIAENRDPYAALEEMAATVPPGSHGIIPIFSDAMDYAHWRHASPSFLNLSVDPNIASRAALFRSLEENAAIVTLANLRRIADLTGKFPEEITFASGASKGALWCQILADVLQIPVHTPVVKEATALGAAICAGVGIGLYEGFDSAVNQLVRKDKSYRPNPKNASVYNELYERWLAAYPAQLSLADQGITTSMWRAPGE